MTEKQAKNLRLGDIVEITRPNQGIMRGAVDGFIDGCVKLFWSNGTSGITPIQLLVNPHTTLIPSLKIAQRANDKPRS